MNHVFKFAAILILSPILTACTVSGNITSANSSTPSAGDKTSPSAVSSVSLGAGPALLHKSPSVTVSTDISVSSPYYFEAAIGTSAGATNTMAWTAQGTTSPFTVTSTALKNNQTYYLSVRITDGNSYTSSAQSAGSWVHAPFLISSLSGTSASPFSYVDMDVDWTRKIAYLASRESGKCITTVDFSDETNPVILNVLGTATTPSTAGNTCLGVRLYKNGTRMVLSSYGANKVEVWDLTSNPKTFASWTKLSTLAVTNAKRFDLEEVSATQTRLYIGRRFAAIIADIAEPAGTASLTGTFNYVPDGIESATYLGPNMIGSSSANGEPVQIINPTTMALTTTLNYSSTPIPAPYSWGSSRSADGTLAYVAGLGGAFLQLVSNNVTLSAKHITTGSGIIRDSNFTTESSKNILYSIFSTPKSINRWDMSNPSSPVLTHSTAIADTVREAYAIRSNGSLNRAIVVTNGGMIYLIRTDQLDAASATDVANSALQ